MLHVRLKQERIFFMLHRLAGHADDLGLSVTVWMLDETNNSCDGIANDLAFGPAECGSESL